MDTNKVLIVEGGDDEKVVIELLERRKIIRLFEIRNSKGIPNIFNEIDASIKLRDFETIGIVIDADSDLPARWKEIKEILLENGFKNLPHSPDIKGTIIEANNRLPKVGIWLMPDNQLNGNIENFITFLIPDFEKDILYVKAKKIVEELIEDEENKFSKDHKDKAILHTWLAWQKKPGLSLGQAISNRYSDLLVDKKATDFVNWLQKLFKDK